MAKLSVALRYKPEGHGIDYRWGISDFLLTLIFRLHYGPAVDSASNRNKSQGYFLGVKGGRCVRLTTLPPSFAGCLEILGDSSSWSHKGFIMPLQGFRDLFVSSG